MAGYKDDVILRTKYELMALTARDLVDREYVARAMRAALMGPLFEVSSVLPSPSLIPTCGIDQA